MVDRRWAIDWDAALAPPLVMIPDLSVLVSPVFDDTVPSGEVISRSGAINCAATAVDSLSGREVIITSCPPEWESTLAIELGSVEEEEAAAFQRDSLHL